MDRYVIKKQEIEDTEGLYKKHFLNDNAIRINKSLGDLTGITGFGFHLIEVPPGKESTEYHVHYHEDECVYVLSGAGKVTIGDEEFAIAEGDFIGYRSGGKPHTMLNTGANVLKCIVVGERLDHDVAEYPNKAKRIYRNKDMAADVVDLKDIQNPTVGKK